MTGSVIWFNSAKGYGFVKPDDGGADVFVHYSAIEGDGYRLLAENEKVEFSVEAGKNGKPQAANVKRVR